MNKLRFGIVVFSAIIITTLSIDAADTWRGSSGTLLGQLVGSQGVAGCPKGMVETALGQTFRCVDQYEASVGGTCAIANPAGPRDTETNLMNSQCMAISVAGALPWRFVTRDDAGRLCARAGKRLPTAAEWYTAALDTPDMPCMFGNSLRKTGTATACVSAVGIQDAVGNVWEWVLDDVYDGRWEGRLLPSTGYVVQVDQSGIATVTSSTSAEQMFSGAYLWSTESGVFGMIRGGFYGSYDDAGVVALHAAMSPTQAGEAVGFRCVQ